MGGKRSQRLSHNIVGIPINGVITLTFLLLLVVASVDDDNEADDEPPFLLLLVGGVL